MKWTSDRSPVPRVLILQGNGEGNFGGTEMEGGKKGGGFFLSGFEVS